MNCSLYVFNDHNPPHFHVLYQGYDATIEIETGTINGKFPRKALKLVYKWLDLHNPELMNNWNNMQERKPLKKIEFRFSDGTIKRIDLRDELYGEVFKPLRNLENFKNFKLNPFTIEWENRADFAPEFLYYYKKELA